jgi:hypothetical protein
VSSTSARYEEEARRWDESGRPEPAADGWNAMIMSCWIASPGAKHDGVSPRLKDYEAALRKVLDRRNPNWLDDLFDDHEHCSFCGYSWRTENCGICTNCSQTYPPCCPDKRQLKTLPNGNRECSACRDGEIVG